MDEIERIKQKIDIVELLGEYIPLKKMGRNYKALCPFHGEKTPSFIVSPERQMWHCFGCSKGGDLFTFLMEYDKMDFSEALKVLADRAGVTLAAPVFKNEIEKKKDAIYSLNHLAAQFYTYVLLSHPAGKQALSYLLEKRNISTPLIKTFQLGYAPRKANSLVEYLTHKKGYSVEDILDAGLATKRDGRVIDFFRDRIIFSIADQRNNIIAFSGRALHDSTAAGPKYINTRETLVYKKGATLFGLNLARDAIKKEGKVLIVEGEFDVITSHKEGILNIVAVKGTALTEHQIKLLKRYAQKFLFCFDSDPAGTEAQRRSIEMIEREEVTAGVVVLPTGKDPDEILRKNPVLFKKALKEEVNIYEFIIASALAAENKNTADGKTLILAKTLPYLTTIDNEVIKEHYFKKLAEAIDASLESVFKQADKTKRAVSDPIVKPAQKKQSRQELLEGYLLSLLFQSPNPREEDQYVSSHLQDAPLTVPVYQKLLTALHQFFQTFEAFSLNDFVKTLPPELIEAFDTCYLAPIPSFETTEKLTKEIQKVTVEIRFLGIKHRLKSIGELLGEKEQLENEEELEALRNEFNKLTSLLR